jgi:hypothetical protein
MNKIFTLLVVLFCVSLFSYSQEVDLEGLVEDNNKKIEYSPEKLVEIPGTSVKMMPPPHFNLDNEITGFSHAGSASTIQIIEVKSVSYKSIDESMTDEHINSQGFELLERKEVELYSGEKAVMYVVQFDADGTIFERAMLFTGNKNAIWVNFNYPQSMKKLMAPAIEASLLSVQ